MARFKVVDLSPRFLPVVLEQQLVPGTFEHALHTLIDDECDLSGLGAKFKNDRTGAPAYDPAVLLKIVLLAYSRGMVSSRAIERACAENVLFMAMSGDSQPADTTIAAFVRGLSDEIARIFTEVIFKPQQRSPHQYTEAMKQRIDSPAGRALYGRRIATVEPVFANLRHNKGLDRFTLRGQSKVDTQWKLYCMVHNIEKLAHHGYAS